MNSNSLTNIQQKFSNFKIRYIPQTNNNKTKTNQSCVKFNENDLNKENNYSIPIRIKPVKTNNNSFTNYKTLNNAPLRLRVESVKILDFTLDLDEEESEDLIECSKNERFKRLSNIIESKLGDNYELEYVQN